jgi:hypothetical protein
MSTKPVTTAPLRRPHRFGEIDPEGSKALRRAMKAWQKALRPNLTSQPTCDTLKP